MDATQLTRKNASERALVTKNCRGALPWGREMGMIRKAARDYRVYRCEPERTNIFKTMSEKADRKIVLWMNALCSESSVRCWDLNRHSLYGQKHAVATGPGKMRRSTRRD
ncbi:uncharacterized protein BO88DRAFT_101761 [Aspergillus vadensis CBS 113365]|uniref:Uncharacterized protein n=1 Tax=Aspergillus vadensis (strain CBS 113365 / IMI 142717 / IBT 24658) TaxID=1448311 RepID=A0A319C5N9_ASPVC|nr:hypothetical protein BO88DRAFT_101761 [Aspergillus vadensis CBS 113365]PYH73643.1 hypothetical protein BO88DRAFT_101761 [Aspergillus vadensis CBS 113365]